MDSAQPVPFLSVLKEDQCRNRIYVKLFCKVSTVLDINLREYDFISEFF